MADRLYPPIVNYSMPAFLESAEAVRIYFANSDFNKNIDNNKVEIQMTVRYLSNNESALNSNAKARILSFTEFIKDEDRISQTDQYYVNLPSSALAKGFEQGVIYKIQLRFSSVRESNNSLYYPSAAWINSNLMNFSEWSTVCFIKPIAAPSFSILGLEEANTGATVTFASVDSVFTGKYSQGDSSEPLKSWRAILYDATLSSILADSGLMTYTNYDYLAVDNKNSIAFDIVLPYIMTTGQNYILRMLLETRNGYTISEDYVFTCLPTSGENFIGSITLEMIESEGYAKLHISSEDPYFTNLILRRTSSISNFTIWEDLAQNAIANEKVDWDFNDFTIESGVWYRYGVQIRDTMGRRGALTVITDTQMAEFEDAFLLEENNKQLKLKYDFTISSMNINISEAKTDTIGSKYPFVRRNGNMYYRTFQCSGLITGYMDADAALFATAHELYHGTETRYAQIRDVIDEQVNQYDYTYEREFREKVQEFLYDNKIKLFKSAQEGNILVKLMNISLTPKNELGRLLYSFSAQAVEIDEPHLSILQTYNIQPVTAYQTAITFEEARVQQLSSFITSENPFPETLYKKDQNIIQSIAYKFGWSYSSGTINKAAKNNIVVNDFQLTYLRIEFESNPYLIVKDGKNIYPLEKDQSTLNQFLVYGWIVNINNTPILVQMPNNIYEIKEEGFVLNSSSTVTFPVDTQATVYYTSKISQEIDPGLTPVSLSYKKIIGQLRRFFEPDYIRGSVLTLLRRKYAVTADTTEASFDSLLWADIEAEPGTIFYARSSASATATKFVMNDTCNYLLQPNIVNARIEELYFYGVQLDVRYLYPEYQWGNPKEYHYNADLSLNQFIAQHDKQNQQPYFPNQFDYYLDNNTLMMYYNQEWYPCTIDSNNPYIYEIKCPVLATINYGIQRKEGVYT